MSQRLINDNFWTDSRIEDKDPTEKLIYLHLLTNPLCNIAWIYEIKIKRIAYETWYDRDTVDEVLDRFVEDSKILRCDDWIVIKNFAKNQSTNPNVLKGMQRIIDNLPYKIKALKGFEALSHFTLLNLTLPNLTSLNSTLPNGEDADDFENSFDWDDAFLSNPTEETSTTPTPPSPRKRSMVNKTNKSEAIAVYDVIKSHAEVVDGSLDDCVLLANKLKKLWDDPSKVLDDIVVAMIHTWQDQFYSIASPRKLYDNLGTIYNKIKANLSKPKVVDLSSHSVVPWIT